MNGSVRRFTEKTVLVAGGTGGLGRAVTLGFLKEGAGVAVTYQRPEEFASLKNAAGDQAAMLIGFQVDVTNETGVRKVIEELLAAHHQIDVLVNAVGGYAGGTPLWELDSPTFEKMLALNLRSGYVLARSVVPAMRRQGSGAIVNIASRAAVDHAAGAAAYAASKAAAVAMIDSLAADLLGSGVRANSVLPSIIDTEANRTAMPHADFSKWPKADDITRVILFLSSDDAKVVHGAAVPVYGAV
jgi:NAD(P)-dependent dehydrogenase (short-subunit alcohol dehydrogenase family)